MGKKDIKIEFLKGQGPGGQRKNKVETACRVTHIPTGIQAYVDSRSQLQSKKLALKELETRLDEYARELKAKARKANRDKKIHERDIIRTYNYSRGEVKDHRTKKTASIKEVMKKGRIDLLTRELWEQE